jgi:hypothetical protein
VVVVVQPLGHITLPQVEIFGLAVLVALWEPEFFFAPRL